MAAQFSIWKVFSVMMMIAMLVITFIWMTASASDLSLFFGFRTSHTIANDISNIMTSLSAVPGTSSAQYKIAGGSADSKVEYKIYIYDNVACAESKLPGAKVPTIDCASHPFSGESLTVPKGLSIEERTELCLEFTKMPSFSDKKASMKVELC